MSCTAESGAPKPKRERSKAEKGREAMCKLLKAAHEIVVRNKRLLPPQDERLKFFEEFIELAQMRHEGRREDKKRQRYSQLKALCQIVSLVGDLEQHCATERDVPRWDELQFCKEHRKRILDDMHRLEQVLSEERVSEDTPFGRLHEPYGFGAGAVTRSVEEIGQDIDKLRGEAEHARAQLVVLRVQYPYNARDLKTQETFVQLQETLARTEADILNLEREAWQQLQQPQPQQQQQQQEQQQLQQQQQQLLQQQQQQLQQQQQPQRTGEQLEQVGTVAGFARCPETDYGDATASCGASTANALQAAALAAAHIALSSSEPADVSDDSRPYSPERTGRNGVPGVHDAPSTGTAKRPRSLISPEPGQGAPLRFSSRAHAAPIQPAVWNHVDDPVPAAQLTARALTPHGTHQMDVESVQCQDPGPNSDQAWSSFSTATTAAAAAATAATAAAAAVTTDPPSVLAESGSPDDAGEPAADQRKPDSKSDPRDPRSQIQGWGKDPFPTHEQLFFGFPFPQAPCEEEHANDKQKHGKHGLMNSVCQTYGTNHRLHRTRSIDEDDCLQAPAARALVEPHAVQTEEECEMQGLG